MTFESRCYCGRLVTWVAADELGPWAPADAATLAPHTCAETNPRAFLGVTATAPIEVVRAAWRALSRLHHPDVGGSNEAQLELNRALAAIESGE